MEALGQVQRWPSSNAAVAVVTPAGVAALYGDPGRAFPWASVTKIATALCVLVAVEEGLIGLEDSAGPPGATVRHLLAHTSGLPFVGSVPIASPGARRIYSNEGFELAAGAVAAAAGISFDAYFEAVWGYPLAGSPAAGVCAPLQALIELASELLAPRRISAGMLAQAASVQFPGLGGVLPGFGRYDPNDWGLGVELHDHKAHHWMGTTGSPACFGHFGAAGGFLWVDPSAAVALACLTDLAFGDWARDAWPVLSDSVLAATPAAPAGSWPFAA